MLNMAASMYSTHTSVCTRCLSPLGHAHTALCPDLPRDATTIPPEHDAVNNEQQLDPAAKVPRAARGAVKVAVDVLNAHAPLIGKAASLFSGTLSIIVSLLLLARVYAGAYPTVVTHQSVCD